MGEVYSFLEDNGEGLSFEQSLSSEEKIRKRAQELDLYPSNVLEAAEVDEPEYDEVYRNLDSDFLSGIEMVGIDRSLGIVDVFDGDPEYRSNLFRYSLLGMFEGENNPELFFSEEIVDEQFAVYKQTDNKPYENGKTLAAAYESVVRDTGIRDENLQEIKQIEIENTSNLGSLEEIEAKRKLKHMGNFLEKCSDKSVTGFTDFEQQGKLELGRNDHYSSRRGFKAAEKFASDLRKLEQSGIIGYDVKNPNDTGDEKNPVIEIEDQFLDSEGVREYVRSFSEFDYKNQDENGKWYEQIVEKRL